MQRNSGYTCVHVCDVDVTRDAESLLLCGTPTPGLEHLGLEILGRKNLRLQLRAHNQTLTPTLGLTVWYTVHIKQIELGVSFEGDFDSGP